MKKSTFSILLGCLFLFVQCKEEKEPIQFTEPDPPNYDQICQQSVTTTFDFENIVPDGTMYDNKIKVSVTLPSCYQLTGVFGVDDQYGSFVVPELDIVLSFGIGEPAGTNGLDGSTTKTEELINGRPFWYEEKDDKVYFSFPTAGPASFVTSNVEYKDEFVNYLRSLTFRTQ